MSAMTLAELILLLILIGLVLYLINTFLPLDARIKVVINVIVLMVIIILLLNAFGLINNIGRLRL
ncbi:MAG: Thivi_2564 family membrane protein [Bacteroidota bacterium]|nr:Thivi_2564 family membrane protein [Bacteroidota bacterium]